MKRFICAILFSFICFTVEALPKPILELKSNNIELVYDSILPVIIDVYAPDCQCCQALDPIFSELHKEYGTMIEFTKLNAKKESHFIDYFRLKRVPTIIFMKNGKELDRHVGPITKEELRKEINRNFNN